MYLCPNCYARISLEACDIEFCFQEGTEYPVCPKCGEAVSEEQERRVG